MLRFVTTLAGWRFVNTRTGHDGIEHTVTRDSRPIVVLEDGTTWTGLNGCHVVYVPHTIDDDDIEEWLGTQIKR